jgi:hypothetical protein
VHARTTKVSIEFRLRGMRLHESGSLLLTSVRTLENALTDATGWWVSSFKNPANVETHIHRRKSLKDQPGYGGYS